MPLSIGKQVFYNWQGTKLTATVSKIFAPENDFSDVSLHIRNPTVGEFNFQFIERVSYGINTSEKWEYSPYEIDRNDLIKDVKQYSNAASITNAGLTYITMTGMSLIADAKNNCNYKVSARFVVTSLGNNRPILAAIFVNGVEDTSTTVNIRLSNVLDQIITLEKIYSYTGTPVTFDVRWRNSVANTLTSATRNFYIEQI